MNNNRVLLTILDGFGVSDKIEGNAIRLANTPNYDRLLNDYPNRTIRADGLFVGLPEGQMGNSEVGHLNIGAGRVVYQELTRINKSIKDGEFFENRVLLTAVENVKKNNSAMHIMGLVSPGCVHSSMDHMYALFEMAKRHNIKKFYLHAFLDGRDTPPSSASGYLKEVEEKLAELNLPKIASVMGRYYAMDRDNRWERVQKAYDALLAGEGIKAQLSYEAVKASYNEGVNDEFVMPIVVLDDARIKDNDSIIFFNFRPDRARELTRAINNEDFNGFERKKVIKNQYYVCMTQYDETFTLPIAYPPHHLTNIMADVMDKYNLKQFRTAETEKYAHVTFFFNGGVEKAHKTETRVLVNSPKVATYDLKPEMSAFEVCEKVVNALNDPEFSFMLVNFANPDMVGHTGVLEAAIKAIEAIDIVLGKIVEAVKQNNVTMLLTADHGNAECMIDPDTGEPHTAHTTNPVPLILINSKDNYDLSSEGKLADLVPTVLDLMGIELPEEMSGKSLLVKKTNLVKH
ncbi:MAG: 2,3-bisphosphoglycerate-independent phosphoglycerate mutase [Cyanobacteriota bacterium]